MRLGLGLRASTIEGLVTQAQAAEAVGIELAWLASSGDDGAALLGAAALGAATSVIRLAACVPVGGHPLATAEAVAVADNCSNGRIILVLQDVVGDGDLLAETVDAVLSAVAPRPFRHEGRRWKIPANLPENDQPEERIIVTPQVVQTELPVWLAGPASSEVARARGLAHVTPSAGGTQKARREWELTEAATGPASRRLRRPWQQDLDVSGDGAFDVDGPLTGCVRSSRPGVWTPRSSGCRRTSAKRNAWPLRGASR